MKKLKEQNDGDLDRNEILNKYHRKLRRFVKNIFDNVISQTQYGKILEKEKEVIEEPLDSDLRREND